MHKLMKELKNWTEVTKGIYRYVIAANVSYEIHISYWPIQTDILTAKASLFLVGEWQSKNNANGYTLERECLLSEQPVFECIEAAIKDDEENNE